MCVVTSYCGFEFIFLMFNDWENLFIYLLAIFLLARKATTNLDSILRSRNIRFPTKAGIVKAMVEPVVMYRCESWTIKKAEHQRIDAFELRCWRRLLRILCTGRKSNQSILKEINPKYSLERYSLVLKLKLQFFDHLMWRADSSEKTLMLGRLGARGESTTEDEVVGWHHWLDGHEFEQAPGVGDGQGRLMCCSPWGRKESDMTEQLNWTEHNFQQYVRYRKAQLCRGSS